MASPLKPFLKWAGGKSRLINSYKTFFPETLSGRGYVEPFIGSGAVFFYVSQHLKPQHCTLLDSNPELINVWQCIRDDVEIVIAHLVKHKAKHEAANDIERKEYYYSVRAAVPKVSAARAARFIYLNKTCYNGLYRLNAKGEFNVPMGSYKNPTIFTPEHLRHVSRLLQGVTIEVCPFQECGRFIQDNDFVYCDPPYAPLSPTSNFTTYTKDVFTSRHQQMLRDLLLGLQPRAQWMLSNSAAPLIEQLYASTTFYKHKVFASRTINTAALGRGKIEELLITSYPTHLISSHLSA